MEAAWVKNFRGDTWEGSGEAAGLYFKNGRNRWMKRSWKNMLLTTLIHSFRGVGQGLLHDEDVGQLTFLWLHLFW